MSRSKRITITIYNDLDEATALRKATYLVECSPSREHNIYWKDGTAAGFSPSAKGTAIQVWKSNLYDLYYKENKNEE